MSVLQRFLGSGGHIHPNARLWNGAPLSSSFHQAGNLNVGFRQIDRAVGAIADQIGRTAEGVRHIASGEYNILGQRHVHGDHAGNGPGDHSRGSGRPSRGQDASRQPEWDPRRFNQDGTPLNTEPGREAPMPYDPQRSQRNTAGATAPATAPATAAGAAGSVTVPAGAVDAAPVVATPEVSGSPIAPAQAAADNASPVSVTAPSVADSAATPDTAAGPSPIASGVQNTTTLLNQFSARGWTTTSIGQGSEAMYVAFENGRVVGAIAPDGSDTEKGTAIDRSAVEARLTASGKSMSDIETTQAAATQMGAQRAEAQTLEMPTVSTLDPSKPLAPNIGMVTS